MLKWQFQQAKNSDDLEKSQQHILHHTEFSYHMILGYLKYTYFISQKQQILRGEKLYKYKSQINFSRISTTG